MDDTAVYKVLAGRVPTWPERERWQAVMNGSRTLLWVIYLLLTGFFALNALGGAATLLSWQAPVATLAAVGGAVWVLVGFIVHRHQAGNRMKTEWYNEQADRRRLAAGSTVELCGDRVVYTDLRRRVVIPYNRVTRCTESIDGFLITAGIDRILIRGGDLTADELTDVRQWLESHIPAAVFFRKAFAVPLRLQPLPVMGFISDDSVIARGVVTVFPPQVKGRLSRLTWTLILPAAVVYGTLIATVFSVGNVLADLFLFCGGIAAVGTLCLWLFTLSLTKRRTVQLAFTKDGLAWNADGHNDFMVWERIRVTPAAAGLRLWFFDGTALFVPFKQLEDPDALRRFFVK